MIPPRYAVHIRLKTSNMNPCTVCVYIAFSERHAYEWINGRNYPKSYTAYVKPLCQPTVEYSSDDEPIETLLLPS